MGQLIINSLIFFCRRLCARCQLVNLTVKIIFYFELKFIRHIKIVTGTYMYIERTRSPIGIVF